MKVNLVFWLLLLISYSGFAQYFSGEVEYRTRIVPKVKGLNTDSILALQPGTSAVYKITEGYYKSTYFKKGKEVYSYTYHADTKRMFDAYPEKDYVTFRDSRKANNPRIRSVIYKDSTRTVAGHPCFMAERVYENYISKIYYAKDLRINPESFKDHATGDWYNQIKEVAGALSLGSVNEYAQYVEIDEVVRVTPMKLTRTDFALPAGKLVIASATALDMQVDLLQPSKETILCYQNKSAAALAGIATINHVVYVGFIVKANGQVTHVEPYEKDAAGLYKTAVDIVQNCGLQFSKGMLGGKAVDSWVYFPIEFKK